MESLFSWSVWMVLHRVASLCSAQLSLHCLFPVTFCLVLPHAYILKYDFFHWYVTGTPCLIQPFVKRMRNIFILFSFRPLLMRVGWYAWCPNSNLIIFYSCLQASGFIQCNSIESLCMVGNRICIVIFVWGVLYVKDFLFVKYDRVAEWKEVLVSYYPD